MSMNISAKTDYSSLFNSLGTRSSSSTNYVNNLSSLISDYGTIKSGAYYKLTKAYYALDKKDESSKSSALSSLIEKKNISSETATELSETAKSAQEVSDSLSDLSSSSLYTKNSKSGKYDWDTLTSNISNFVDNYNDLYTNASSSTNSGVSKFGNYLKTVSTLNKDDLANVGITVNDNGKLSLDKKAFKSADIDDIKALFGGTGYSKKISSVASNIESAATKAASANGLYSSDGTSASSASSLYSTLI